MKIVRFPIEELSADYGDIIIEAVSSSVEAIISIDGSEILNEVFSPNSLGIVKIKDVGKLAMMYKASMPLTLENGIDGKYLILDISLKEDDESFDCPVKIYCCEAETGDTLAVGTLINMPLSRVSKRNTSLGRIEFVSFYGDADLDVSIKADVYYSEGECDKIKTIEVGIIEVDNISFYRFDVSLSVIAALSSIDESKIIQYTIYKSESDSITFFVEKLRHLNESTFFFRNVFNAIDSFTCTGDEESERKWIREFGVIDSVQRQIAKELLHTYKVNTGLISRSSIGLLEDLMNSERVYYLEGDQLREVSIIDESFKITTRKDQQIAVEFKYKYASNNQMQFRSNKRRIFDYTFDYTFN